MWTNWWNLEPFAPQASPHCNEANIMNTRSIDMHLYKCISISVFNKGGRLSNYLANQLRCVLIEHSHEKTNNAYAKTKTQHSWSAPLFSPYELHYSSSTYIQSFKLLALFRNCTAWFVSDLVINANCLFSHAQAIWYLIRYWSLEKVPQDLFHSVYFEYEENSTHDRLLSLNYAFCHIKRLIKTSEPVYTD